MNERKVKGKPVIYVPAKWTFTALDGQKYMAVPDFINRYPCIECAFRYAKGLCGRYRCIADDREDGTGVHFVECKGEQSKTN